MDSGQPGLSSCLTLHSLLIPTPLQTSFSGGSSPLGGILSRLIISIVCHLTRSRLRPHPARPDVPHVPDNRRPKRRMMVGTRTTARDWQWLDEMIAEDAPTEQTTQEIRRMTESYARRRGAGRPRRGGRAGRGREEVGDTTPTQQTQGGASISQAVEDAGTSSQAYLPSTPQTQGTAIPTSMSSPSQQAFLNGLSSVGFQEMISDILQEGDGGYRPDTQFDG
ncbi:hypothetical protein PIB30_055831 [Stylosanthes scabra]|uniref:Uncharacterized protein n=1 Tax=Stylosanthes scabra TaxID=79078 RepID=A0ABU6XJG3_9FABA|nr:hypothetical protein [Stylosanthes scabra]